MIKPLMCSMRCRFKALSSLVTLWISARNVCHQALKHAVWWTAFLKAFWSTQEALVIVQQPSKVIERLLTVKGQHEGRWQGEGESSEVPACSIRIRIELLFRILISAQLLIFFPPHLSLINCFRPPVSPFVLQFLQCPTITVLHITAEWPKLAALWV